MRPCASVAYIERTLPAGTGARAVVDAGATTGDGAEVVAVDGRPNPARKFALFSSCERTRLYTLTEPMLTSIPSVLHEFENKLKTDADSRLVLINVTCCHEFDTELNGTNTCEMFCALPPFR